MWTELLGVEQGLFCGRYAQEALNDLDRLTEAETVRLLD